MAAAMVTLIKSFAYRAETAEEWSNSYHLDAAPADRAAWVNLVKALALLELHVYDSDVSITRALVYNDSDHAATFSFAAATEGFSHVGDLVIASGSQKCAGDQAATLGWNTGLLGSTGKPIWLRKYYHGSIASASPDAIAAGTLTAMNTFGTALLGTAIDGAIHFADKNGRRPDGPRRVDPYMTTRTLKRRGKRPTS